MNGITLRGQAFIQAKKDSEDIFFLKNKIERENLQSTLNRMRESSNTGGNMAIKGVMSGSSANQHLQNIVDFNKSLSSDGIKTSYSTTSNGITYGSTGNTGNTSSFGSSSIGDLKNVFTELGNISETKAQNDQRRFREDLPFQSRIYQDFDTEAAKRTEGIDTRAREQNSNLTKDRMRLQSTLSKDEEVNKGKVQVNTTGQTRDADLKRALSVLPRK